MPSVRWLREPAIPSSSPTTRRCSRSRGTGVAHRPLDLRFLGAGPEALPEARSRASGTVNRLTGSAATRRPTSRPTEELVYRELWPRIDLVVPGRRRRAWYEFHLDPGADPRDIRLDYDGANGLSLGSTGILEIDTPAGRAGPTRSPVSLPGRAMARACRSTAATLEPATAATASPSTDYDRSLPARDRPGARLLDLRRVARARLGPRDRRGRRSGHLRHGADGIRRLPDHPGRVRPGVQQQHSDVFVTKLDSDRLDDRLLDLHRRQRVRLRKRNRGR